jgi:chitin disaccharide deacetylase
MTYSTLSICADDIGQDPSINDGVLHLFSNGRLSHASVLTFAPYVKTHRDALIEARQQGLQVGLHFNLTLAFDGHLYCQDLNNLILRSQLRALPTQTILFELQQQFNRFAEIFGSLPDFIDGHQHVHQFPQIRELLLQEILLRYPSDQKPWLRSTVLPQASAQIPESFKAHLLNWLGGNRFKQQLDDAGLQHNAGFLGVYGFNAPSTTAYRSLMQMWLRCAVNNTLVMCHPASYAVNHDAIGAQRPIEFAYLNSAEFLEDLEQNHLKIGKLGLISNAEI